MTHRSNQDREAVEVALIEIHKEGSIDFREVPVKFLKPSIEN